MINRILPKSNFTKNIITLITGTTIAQALPIIASPILTRIYDPSDFGVFALFIAITTILASITNARYELAVLLPKKNEDAVLIVSLGLIINLIITSFLLIIITLFNYEIVNFFKLSEFSIWLYYIPITVFLIGIYNLLYYFNTRIKEYKDLRNSIIIKSIVLTVIQIAVGFIKPGVFGLITGDIISRFFANMKLLKNLLKFKIYLTYLKNLRLLALAKKYKQFPIFSLPAVLFSNFSYKSLDIYLPIIYNINTLGFYSLADRVLGSPIALISKAISQVYYQEAADNKNASISLYEIFTKTLKKLVVLSVLIFFPLYFVIEEIFIFVFGIKWEESAIIAKYLIFLFFCRFIVSPLTVTPFVYNKVKIDFYFQFTMFLLSLILCFICFIFKLDFYDFIMMYSGIIGFYYIFYLIYLFILVKRST